MLTLIEAIRQRRSIRSFRSDPVSDQLIDQMLEADRLAPSGGNRQPWRFIVVTDASEKAKLRQLCGNQAFIEQAPVVFVCATDLTAYSQAARRQRWQEFVDSGTIETMSGRLRDPTYRAQMLAEPEPDLKQFVTSAVANAYIAIEHLALMATALGLGTCWVGAMNSKREIEEFLGLPETTMVVALLPIGYSTSVPAARPRLALSQLLLRPLPVASK